MFRHLLVRENYLLQCFLNPATESAKVEFAAKVFPIIEETKSAGVQTLRGICDCLNRRGISTRNGKNWYPATVRNILKMRTA
jgi:hypothetical protein